MTRKSKFCLFAPWLIVTTWGAAHAAAPCSGPEFHQFDFWLGEWQVRKTDGTVAGINRIDLEYAGCVVHEHYVTGRGYSGESLNIYDASRKVWHQTWVDNTGLLLTLEGHLIGNNMVLQGQIRQSGGEVTKQRITWSPNADGSVRQLWESMDSQGQWTVAFDGLYSKK
jgi:hypothetical protein